MDVNLHGIFATAVRIMTFIMPSDGITPPVKYTIVYSANVKSPRNRVTQGSFHASDWYGDVLVLKHDFVNHKEFVNIGPGEESTVLVDCIARMPPL